MNENLNLVEILKDCPKGTKLYSTTYGDVEFTRDRMKKDEGQFKNWETVVLRNKISKWAYISDLFPKGGEQ